jgi:hypothetical protein
MVCAKEVRVEQKKRKRLHEGIIRDLNEYPNKEFRYFKTFNRSMPGLPSVLYESCALSPEMAVPSATRYFQTFKTASFNRL